MKTSDNGRKLIESFEGLVLYVYKDVAGIDTIGYGHVLRNGELFPDGITQAQADQLLAGDLRVAEGCVSQNTPSSIGQNAFDAMVSLTFNIGTGAFVKSSVCKFVNAGDYLAAADAFLLWSKAMVGGVLTPVPALAARRQKEREVFLRDVSTLASP